MRAGLGRVERDRRAGVGHADAARGGTAHALARGRDLVVGGLALDVGRHVVVPDGVVAERRVRQLLVRERRGHALPRRAVALARAVKERDLEPHRVGRIRQDDRALAQRALARFRVRCEGAPPDPHSGEPRQLLQGPARGGEDVDVRRPGPAACPQQPRPPQVAALGPRVVVAGSDEDGRTARDPEDVERERHGPGIHALDVEQVARDQDGVGAALDGLAHRLLERAALIGAPLGAPVRRQPPERPAEVEVGNLKETRDCHWRGKPPNGGPGGQHPARDGLRRSSANYQPAFRPATGRGVPRPERRPRLKSFPTLDFP